MAVSFQEAALLLEWTCSEVLAPAMTLLTSGFAASHEKANSKSEWLRDSANSISLSTISRLSSVKIFGPKASLPLLESGNGLSLRYFPESRPLASGK